MRTRWFIHWFLILFGIVVGVSFSYGLYLMQLRRPSREAQAAMQSGQGIKNLVRTAALHLASRHVEQALVVYRQVLTLDPNSIEAQLGVAHGELLAGREAVAAREYERVLSLDRTDTTALHQLARIYSHKPDTWSQSESKYRELLNLNSDDVTSRLELARVLVWERKPRETVEMFSPDNVRRQMTFEDQKEYAFALVQIGRSSEGETLLKKLAAERPKDSGVELQLAAIYAARRDWDRALPLYAELLRSTPDDARLNLTYGLGLLAIKKYREALGPLQKASKEMPSSTEARLGYARALKGSGDLKKAAKEFGRAVAKEKDPGIVREYADLLMERHDYGGAEKFYKEALRLGLHDKRLLMGLAGSLRANGKQREAVRYLEDVYREEPSDRVAFELATTLQKAGRDKEALALLRKIENPSKSRSGN
jgi:tetratricopeptide (TPR) repeat protein